MAPKQGKVDEKQSELVEIAVGRSDGQDYSTATINLKSRSTKGSEISEPVTDTGESDHLRAWQIKLGKAVKYNLGIESDSEFNPSPAPRPPSRVPPGPAIPSGALASRVTQANLYMSWRRD